MVGLGRCARGCALGTARTDQIRRTRARNRRRWTRARTRGGRPRADGRRGGRSRGLANRDCSSSSRRWCIPDAWCSRPSGLAWQGQRVFTGNRFAAAVTSRSRSRTTTGGARKSPARSLKLDRSLEDALPYLYGLLGIVEGADPLAQMDPQIRKQRTLEAIKRMLLREILNQPLIVIFEDLHWIDERDPGAARTCWPIRSRTAKILLLVNYRPEYSHRMGQQDLLHATPARSAGQGKRERNAFRAARRRVESRRSSGQSSNGPKAIRSSWRRPCRCCSTMACWYATGR